MHSVALDTWCPKGQFLPRGLSLYVPGKIASRAFPATEYHCVVRQGATRPSSAVDRSGVSQEDNVSSKAVSCIGEKPWAYQSNRATVLAERRGPTKVCLVSGHITGIQCGHYSLGVPYCVLAAEPGGPGMIID